MSRELELQEYIKILENRHKTYIAALVKDIDVLKEQINVLKYALKGASSEHLSIKYSISPEMLIPNIRERDFIDAVSKHTNNMMVHQIEEKLGNRYKLEEDYSKALQYIRYLQNHMDSKAIYYKSFEQRVN